MRSGDPYSHNRHSDEQMFKSRKRQVEGVGSMRRAKLRAAIVCAIVIAATATVMISSAGTAAQAQSSSNRALSGELTVFYSNRGEIAVRIIRAAHELGIETVAVYSPPTSMLFTSASPTARVCIGPPAAADSYLRIPSVIAAAATTGWRRSIRATASSPRTRRSSRHASTTTSSSSARPRGDAAARRQGPGEGGDARRAGVPLVPGPRAPRRSATRAARSARSGCPCC